MNQQSQDTWRTQYSIETSASPATLWRIFSDVSGWKTWNTGIETIEMRGPFAVGSEFVMTPPGQEPLLSKMIEVRENELFTDETRVGDTFVVVTHRIERMTEDTTRVTYAIQATGPECAEIGPAASADFPDVLKALVKLAEAQA